MELLRIHKNRSLDNRKCQEFTDPATLFANRVEARKKEAKDAEQAAADRAKISDRQYVFQLLKDMYKNGDGGENGNGNGHWGRHEFTNYFLNHGFNEDQLKGDWFKDARRMLNHGLNQAYYTDTMHDGIASNFSAKSKAEQEKEVADKTAADYNQKAGAWAMNEFNNGALDEDFYNRLQETNGDASNLATLWSPNDSATMNKISSKDKKGNWYGTAAKKAEQDYYNTLNPLQQRAYNKWRQTQNWSSASNLGDNTQFRGADVSADKVSAYANDPENKKYMDEQYKSFYGADGNYKDDYKWATESEKPAQTAQQNYFGQQATPATTQHSPENPRSYANKRYANLGQASTVSSNKQGGSLKMKVNYFQPGGVVAAQTASAKPDVSSQLAKLILTATQDEKALTQVVQLLQSGEPQVQEAIKTMTAKAQQGDEEAAQATQVLQAIMKKMQGQAQSAKRGAKLSYLHSLKTGCPDGYEVSYNKKGGHLCKECLKKQANGGELSEEDKKMGRGTPEQVKAVVAQLKKKYPQYTKEQLAGSAPIIKNGQKYFMNGDGELIEASKLTPKDACGSKLKKKLISGKKLAEGNKITSTKQAPKNFFGGKLYLNY